MWLAGSFSLDVNDADSVVCLMASSVSDGSICCSDKYLLCIPVGHYKIKEFWWHALCCAQVQVICHFYQSIL
jgi:hypothetical protein